MGKAHAGNSTIHRGREIHGEDCGSGRMGKPARAGYRVERTP